MKQIATKGIILSRTNFAEADRIITVLSPDQGKIRLVAKGVRKIKSRMAGGIELFSINDISYIVGKGDLHTLISTRLRLNFGTIVKDINRTMYAYEMLKIFNKITEDAVDSEYFELLSRILAGLNDQSISLLIMKLWCNCQLLLLGGHAPNLITDTQDKPLERRAVYSFSFDDMTFTPHTAGLYGANQIKLLRLCFGVDNPKKITHVTVDPDIVEQLEHMTKNMVAVHMHIK